MIREAVSALLACVVTFVLCAVAYPALVYGFGHTLFPHQADGSLIERDGKVIGSELIAQPFASEKYFSPRPSAAGATGYAADAASGSNLGTTNPALHDRIALESSKQVLLKTGDADLKAKLDRLDSLQGELKAKNDLKEKSKADEEAIAKLTEQVSATQTAANDRAAELGKTSGNDVPVDLVTTSGAGLDPEISPEAAFYQSGRIAKARNVPVDRIVKLIDDHTNTSGFIIGAPPRVNVLQLNLDLDKEIPASSAPATEAPPAKAAAEPTGAPPESKAAAAVEPAPAPHPNSVEVLAGDVKDLKGQVAKEVDELKNQVAKLTEAPDPTMKRLGEVDEHVASFGRDLQAIRTDLKAIHESVPKNNEVIAQLEKQVQTLRGDLDTLRDAAKKDAMAATATVKPEPAIDLAPATKLFQDQQYAAAAEAFRTLSAAHPNDARVWYYAAIATGLATNQWKGQTEEFVNKGMERERAGTPAMAEIDAAFAGLALESGKDWLGFYRAKAAKR